MKNWAQRYTLEIIIGALIVGIVALSAFMAKAQVPPTADEMVNGVQYLNNSELVAVSDAIMARRVVTNPLGVVASGAYWMWFIYGTTVARTDTVLVQYWRSSWPVTGTEPVAFEWQIGTRAGDYWSDVFTIPAIPDSFIWAQLRLCGVDSSGAVGPWSLPGKVE